MTDEQIEKALNCCQHGTLLCECCPYVEIINTCNNNLIADTIEYINRLKSEKERIRKIISCLRKYNGKLYKKGGTCLYNGHYINDLDDLVNELANEYNIKE